MKVEGCYELRRTQGGELPGCKHPLPPFPNEIKTKHELCRHDDIKDLRDLHFSHYSRLINNTVE
jgi:hypothetical protein